MAHPNEDLLRRGYHAFEEGDMETLDELFADDVTWHSAGDNPIAGDFSGKQEVFENFGRIRELTDAFEQQLHDVLANDEHALALVKQKIERGGESVEVDAVHVFHVEDGKVTSAWIHPYDQYEADAFWSS